eukprot:scaffold2631_cov373-Pavlova_lutheri.AAC.6
MLHGSEPLPTRDLKRVPSVEFLVNVPWQNKRHTPPRLVPRMQEWVRVLAQTDEDSLYLAYNSAKFKSTYAQCVSPMRSKRHGTMPSIRTAQPKSSCQPQQPSTMTSDSSDMQVHVVNPSTFSFSSSLSYCKRDEKETF